MEREKLVKIVSDGLRLLAHQLEGRAALQLYDLNIVSEGFFRDFLNLLRNLNLQNLNTSASPQPAIDLGDKIRRICFQVTTDNTARKIQECLNTFLNSGLNQQYDEINVLILGSKKAQYTVNGRSLNFDPRRHVIDLNDLIREAGGLDHSRLEKLAKLVMSNGLSTSGKKGRRNPVAWVVVTSTVLVSCLIVYAVKREHHETARLKLALQFGPSNSLIWFTNSSLPLLRRHFIVTDRDSQFTLHANNCLVIPVDSDESNFVFKFYVRNDSPIAVDNLELGVALPKQWHGFVDPSWREARIFMDLPGPELDLTNMYCWAKQVPIRLYPTDGYHFPGLAVINIAQPNEQSNRVDGIAARLRANGINQAFFTYVLFFRTTNSMKPFFSPIDMDAIGHVKFLITREQLEQSQR